MPKVTRIEHDVALDLFRKLRARDPEAAARALDRSGADIDQAALTMRADLWALNDVATAWSTNTPCPAASVRHFNVIVLRERLSAGGL